MKTNREKFLLGTLLSILVLVLYFNFIFKDQSLKVKKLKMQRADIQNKVDELEYDIKNMDNQEQKLKINNSKIVDENSKLYPEIIQEKIITEIDKLLTSSNVNGSLSFTNVNDSDVLKDSKDNDDQNKNNTSSESTLLRLVREYDSIDKVDRYTKRNNKLDNVKLTNEPIKQISANIDFVGKYEDIQKFIKSIDDNERKIAISDIKMAQNSNKDIVGNMKLTFFAVPKLGDQDDKYSDWNYLSSYGKSDMFDPSNNTTIDNLQTDLNKNDFLMRVTSVNSDLPAIILGQSNDKNRVSYLYKDDNSSQNIKVYLTQNDGKYYFKFGNSSKREFKPFEKDINFKIKSSPREADNDNVSVNLKIYNDTDRAVNVLVENDDTSNPRINIQTGSGLVNKINK